MTTWNPLVNFSTNDILAVRRFNALIQNLDLLKNPDIGRLIPNRNEATYGTTARYFVDGGGPYSFTFSSSGNPLLVAGLIVAFHTTPSNVCLTVAVDGVSKGHFHNGLVSSFAYDNPLLATILTDVPAGNHTLTVQHKELTGSGTAQLLDFFDLSLFVVEL